MSLKDKFDKLSKEKKIVSGIVLAMLALLVWSVATAPAKAQFTATDTAAKPEASAPAPTRPAFNPPMQGRGPEQETHFSVNFETTDGRRVGRGGQMTALPPIGYVYIAATARRERGVRGYVGPRYRVVGGEFTDVSCSSTKCASNATVFVVKE